MQLAIAIKTRDYTYTADTSALKRSVPREQGSRIRHSRPENSAAPASRMHTAMSEVVGPERGEGVVLAHRMLPWKAHAAVVALATLPACSCHTARTVALSLSVSWGSRTRLTGWLAGSRTVGFVTFGNWKRFTFWAAWKERTVCLHGCRVMHSVSMEALCVVSLIPRFIRFEAAFETPCGCCSILRVARYLGLH